MSESDSIDACVAVKPPAHVGSKRGRTQGSRLAVRTVGSYVVFAICATKLPGARWENVFEPGINQLGYVSAGLGQWLVGVVLAQCKVEAPPLDEPLHAKLRKAAGKRFDSSCMTWLVLPHGTYWSVFLRTTSRRSRLCQDLCIQPGFAIKLRSGMTLEACWWDLILRHFGHYFDEWTHIYGVQWFSIFCMLHTYIAKGLVYYTRFRF